MEKTLDEKIDEDGGFSFYTKLKFSNFLLITIQSKVLNLSTRWSPGASDGIY